MLLSWPALAVADGALPFGNPAGGLKPSLSTVQLLQRTEAQAKHRSADGDLDQVLVVPQRPGQTNVRYSRFRWRHYDFLSDHGVGGVRFYYYQREAGAARIAAAVVRQEYQDLARQFRYRPTERVPYILYASHRAFENTNVFFVNESVLGVTSPVDLKMALPYWGDLERFRLVSKHEMAHEFQIQEMADRAAAAGQDSALSAFPRWFVEGLAEFYSNGGIDRKTDLYARDLVSNPRPKRHYVLPSFWSDTKQSYLDTYKLGQLRVAFLAKTYGPRFLQALLDESPKLSAQGSALGGQDSHAFRKFVARLARQTPEQIAERFDAWMKRRYERQYLAATQEPPLVEPMGELPGEPDSFSASPDGELLLYRSVSRQSGRSRLYLADRRAPQDAVEIAVDGHPGIESLHPAQRRVTTLSAHALAFIARDGPADSLYFVPFERRGHGHEVSFDFGRRERIDLSPRGVVEAGDPALSPDEKRLAFFGLDSAGRSDLWIADVGTGRLTRLTDDDYFERDLDWTIDSPDVFGVPLEAGERTQGTILYASDRTETGRLNLFAMDPVTGRSVRLTDEPADERMPCGLGGGKLVFASDAEGKEDLHLFDAKTGRIRRLTDFVTGLSAPAPAPGGGLTALGFFGGRFHLFEVPQKALLDLDEHPAKSQPGPLPPPRPIPREPIPAPAPRYDPLSPKNWRLKSGMAAVGTATVGEGALLFGDVMNDRNLVLQLAMFGAPELTDAVAFYVDRSGRDAWGFGPFHTFTERRDPNAPGFGSDVFYLEREFGVTAMWSHPFDTYSSIQAQVTVQGVDREFQFPSVGPYLTEAVNVDGLRAWNAAHGGYDLEGLASLTYGYDTTRYRFPLGAVGGGSLVAEIGGGYLPLRNVPDDYVTFDAQAHLNLFDLAVLHLRLAGGASDGSVFGRQFYLSSYDNLRNYQIDDTEHLLGTAYAVSNLNLQVPLDSVLHLPLFSNIDGILGMDFGGVAMSVHDLWPDRSLAWVVGVDLGLGPFVLRFEFARPIDIGGVQQPAEWVPNISLQYAYL